MPKLSVYVPDELWDQAKQSVPAAKGKANNSQIVQRALELMLNEQQAKRAAFAAGAVRDEALLAQVVATLLDEARADYSNGYSAGLDLAKRLGFDGVKTVINAGGLNDGGYHFVSVFEDDDAVGEWWTEHGAAFWPHEDDWASGSEAFCDGAAQAIDDVWNALRQNVWGTGTANDAITERGVGDEAEGELNE